MTVDDRRVRQWIGIERTKTFAELRRCVKYRGLFDRPASCSHRLWRRACIEGSRNESRLHPDPAEPRVRNGSSHSTWRPPSHGSAEILRPCRPRTRHAAACTKPLAALRPAAALRSTLDACGSLGRPSTAPTTLFRSKGSSSFWAGTASETRALEAVRTSLSQTWGEYNSAFRARRTYEPALSAGDWVTRVELNDTGSGSSADEALARVFSWRRPARWTGNCLRCSISTTRRIWWPGGRSTTATKSDFQHATGDRVLSFSAVGLAGLRTRSGRLIIFEDPDPAPRGPLSQVAPRAVTLDFTTRESGAHPSRRSPLRGAGQARELLHRPRERPDAGVDVA